MSNFQLALNIHLSLSKHKPIHYYTILQRLTYNTGITYCYKPIYQHDEKDN